MRIISVGDWNDDRPEIVVSPSEVAPNSADPAPDSFDFRFMLSVHDTRYAIPNEVVFRGVADGGRIFELAVGSAHEKEWNRETGRMIGVYGRLMQNDAGMTDSNMVFRNEDGRRMRGVTGFCPVI